jgi:uncharacterized RDD family membrane protein YckC
LQEEAESLLKDLACATRVVDVSSRTVLGFIGFFLRITDLHTMDARFSVGLLPYSEVFCAFPPKKQGVYVLGNMTSKQ